MVNCRKCKKSFTQRHPDHEICKKCNRGWLDITDVFTATEIEEMDITRINKNQFVCSKKVKGVPQFDLPEGAPQFQIGKNELVKQV